MSGEVTGFSFALVAVPKPTLLMEVYHEASGTETLVNGTVDMIIPRTPSRDILVDEVGNLGPLSLHPSSENGIAEIEVYATPAGGTYWVSAEAPQNGDMGQPWTGYASKGSLNQVQTYRNDIPSIFTPNAVCVVSDGLGAVMGAGLVALVGNGLNLIGLRYWHELIVKGGVILLAVSIDTWGRRHEMTTARR